MSTTPDVKLVEHLDNLREELSSALNTVESVEVRVDDDDPVTVELARLADSLNEGLRGLDTFTLRSDPEGTPYDELLGLDGEPEHRVTS